MLDGAASIRPWALPRSTACRWGRGRGHSIRVCCSICCSKGATTRPRLERLLYKEFGLLGVSGISSDMRDLLASAAAEAAEAVELFCAAVAKSLGTLAMAIGGLDAFVFTAGIGEHAAPVRANVCRRTAWLGLRFDAEANARGGPRISTDDSPISAWVIPTDEELMIATHTRDLLASAPAPAVFRFPIPPLKEPHHE